MWLSWTGACTPSCCCLQLLTLWLPCLLWSTPLAHCACLDTTGCVVCLVCACCCQVGEQFQRLQDDTWRVLDASQSIDQLHEQVGGRGAGWVGGATAHR
jgi:hypothetical protein